MICSSLAEFILLIMDVKNRSSMETKLETDSIPCTRYSDKDSQLLSLQRLSHQKRLVTSNNTTSSEFCLFDTEAVMEVCEQLKSVNLSSGNDSDSEDTRCITSDNEDALERIFSQDKDWDTLLHIAIILQREDITSCFIDIAPRSEFLDMPNRMFQTPLHLAVITNQAGPVRRLMLGGADITMQDREGNTALHIACKNGLVEIVKMLLTPVSHQEVLQNSYNPPYQRVPQNLETRNYDGLTCLHLAALCGHSDIVQVLLSLGADVNSRESKSGRTVCHLAAEMENHELLELVLNSSKCDVNCSTYSGMKPLDFSRSVGDYIGFERLVKAGAALHGEEE